MEIVEDSFGSLKTSKVLQTTWETRANETDLSDFSIYFLKLQEMKQTIV